MTCRLLQLGNLWELSARGCHFDREPWALAGSDSLTVSELSGGNSLALWLVSWGLYARTNRVLKEYEANLRSMFTHFSIIVWLIPRVRLLQVVLIVRLCFRSVLQHVMRLLSPHRDRDPACETRVSWWGHYEGVKICVYLVAGVNDEYVSVTWS